ncbi:hypothetical protein Sfulv_39890 [Streptomyces fulvorobeus]|uniref:Peptidoglycan binding domain-containing protein n=1 Tax=Streptomyces fulvorobeus TaxID=284028 RepID=A0A7J0C9Y8_9ACTN|nr:hypothetical protein Sfulv_39890 [Streptomyces fulvorobeus]
MTPEPAEPPRPEEPRTETTLTTRIRINIPGSRPIPPVVMRTPVGEGDTSGGRPDAERTGGTPGPGATTPPAAGNGAGGGPGTDGQGGAAAEPSADRPAREKSGSDWFAPRKAPTATSAAASSGTPAEGAGPAPAPPRPDLPYFSDASQGAGGQGAPRPGAPGAFDGPGAETPGGPGGPNGPMGQGGPGAPGGPRSTPDFGVRTPGPAGPTGPTTGPVTGSSPLTPNLGAPHGTGAGAPAGPGPAFPAGPGGAPPRMSDDTTILRAQPPAPEPGPAGHVSGDTLTSGIPVIPADSRAAFPPGPGGPGGARTDAPTALAPAPKAAAPAKKKGRSKLVLLGVGVVVLAGLAYGAGLLLNHSEVPRGTTVLGVDIGGGTKEEAVTKLEAALGERAASPLKLSVDGKTEKLVPQKAGLTLDSQETVREAAGSDYNPVSVIGSLFGGARPADPVIPVDEEKLGVALTDLAGISGTAQDGTIRFEPNKAVAVPGKTGKTLDVNQSLISVRDAYRAQVQTGNAGVVELPVASREPSISQAELDRAMKEFAEPAMSGLITIKAGPKQIQFGPARSLPQILSMKAVDGRLVDSYDKQAIETLLDGVFDGVMAVKGDGKKYPVSADDVAQAMKTALIGRTDAERTVTIDLTGNG